jgi:ferric-dicitrate binding protein FerR (iron transport regulator)
MKDLEQLARLIASEEDALREGGEKRAAVRARVLSLPQKRASALRPRLAVALAAALVVSAVLLVIARNDREKGPYVLVGRSQLEASVGTWLHASESEPLPLAFSDGTRVEMAPKSRARVLVLQPGETRLLLESGRVHVEVAHRPGQNFSVVTGPFNVRVTGTRFDLMWSPDRDQLELALAEGQVELSGCVFGTGRKLAAGQRVEASCRTPRIAIAYSAASAAPAGSAPSAEEARASESAALPSPSGNVDLSAHGPAETTPARKPEASPATRSRWLELAQQGSYAEAFAAADGQGFEELCQRASPVELSLLAETARHAGQPGRARAAFLTLRRRFPSAKEAGLAAFSLGLLEFDGFGAYAKAADWFQTYLKERPGGPLTREARGRAMEATQRSGRRTEARNLALTYLLDYPAGPHAELARRIVSSP